MASSTSSTFSGLSRKYIIAASTAAGSDAASHAGTGHREEYESGYLTGPSKGLASSCSEDDSNKAQENKEEEEANQARPLLSVPQKSSSTEEGEEETLLKPVTFSCGENFISERDTLDVVKMAYIMSVTELRVGDLISVSGSTHELWQDLKEALISRSALSPCSKTRRSLSSRRPSLDTAGQCQASSAAAPRESLDELNSESGFAKREFASRHCPVSERLKTTLGHLVSEGLLTSLAPFLLLGVKADGQSTSSPSSTSSGANSRQCRDSTGEYQPDLLGGYSGSGSVSGVMPGGSARRRASSKRGSSGRTGSLRGSGRSEESDFGEASNKTTREVTIHVCDDNRNEKRDFVCSQDLLLNQMGYFRDITAGQSLDDVDISVHCDVKIFEWLMDWIRHSATAAPQPEADPSTAEASGPLLEPGNIMSILVSASFLKMDNLVELALKYAHSNMNKILVITHNLNCLGEPLLTKLSLLYKPSEVEELLDRRDRIHSKLYTKLILALSEPTSQPEREIFSTAASLGRCRLCGLFLTRSLADKLPCLPLRSTINRRGEIVPKHQRDPSFHLNDFVRSLRSELKSWRRVFWRLWGICHALQCSLCGHAFQTYLAEFCSFHPQDPEFPAMQFKNSTQPFGHYPCCDEQVYRYQPVNQHGRRGCQSRDHRVKFETDEDKDVYRVLMAHRDVICLSPARKSGIKISGDSHSITLPRPMQGSSYINMALLRSSSLSSSFASSSSPPKVVIEDDTSRSSSMASSNMTAQPFLSGSTANLSLVPALKRVPLIERTYERKKLPESTLTPVSGPGTLKKSLSSSSLSSATCTTTVKFAAKRWRTLTYGRLRRAPKLPTKPQPSTETSSSDDDDDDDLSEDSSLGDDDGEEEEETGLAYDSAKDLCIEIKLAKDKDRRDPNAPDKGRNGQMAISTPGKGGTNGALGVPGQAQEKKNPLPENMSVYWMRWDPERTTRANQDQQRELESGATRDLVKHLGQLHVNASTYKTCGYQISSSDYDHPTQAFPPSPSPLRSWPHSPAGASNPHNFSLPGYSPSGGTFLRLEQDWRETHMAYLQHRSAASRATTPLVGIGATSGGKLTAAGAIMRPSSAASMRSGRLMRIGGRC